MKKLLILKYLMIHDSASTSELTRYAECNRRTVYNAMIDLELAGFPIIVTKPGSRAEKVYSWDGRIMGH